MLLEFNRIRNLPPGFAPKLLRNCSETAPKLLWNAVDYYWRLAHPLIRYHYKFETYRQGLLWNCSETALEWPLERVRRRRLNNYWRLAQPLIRNHYKFETYRQGLLWNCSETALEWPLERVRRSRRKLFAISASSNKNPLRIRNLPPGFAPKLLWNCSRMASGTQSSQIICD